MEQYERDLIAKYAEKDEDLKDLWDKHISYEKMLEKYETKPYLTPAEDQEVKEIKKKKLAGKTKIHTILSKYKETEE
ncbi:MAG: DUF465 domain-containing protein [Desulfonatronovibrio sp.]